MKVNEALDTLKASIAGMDGTEKLVASALILVVEHHFEVQTRIAAAIEKLASANLAFMQAQGYDVPQLETGKQEG